MNVSNKFDIYMLFIQINIAHINSFMILKLLHCDLEK